MIASSVHGVVTVVLVCIQFNSQLFTVNQFKLSASNFIFLALRFILS